MTKLPDIMDPALLATMLTDGYVRVQTHPTYPYAIYNYTEKAAYDGVWNSVTMQCRGLIVNYETLDIVARPFRKFFNYGQRGAPNVALDTEVVVTDKMDGSLGILYPAPDGSWHVATRGSFTSEQATHATQLFAERYASNWTPMRGYTYLFEIVYPENRIVLNYGHTDDLVLIGAVDILTGWSIPLPHVWSHWPGPSSQVLSYTTLSEALCAPLRPNAEGLVVHFTDTDERIKIKQDDYVALHRILTGTSARTIWTYLAVNACRHMIGTRIKRDHHWGTYLGVDPRRANEILVIGENWTEQFIANVPDEFFDWVDETIARMKNEVEELRRSLKSKFYSYAAEAKKDGVFSRTRYWELMQVESTQHRGMIMAMLNGQDITAQLWKCVYPGVELPFKKISEDTA